MATLYVLFEIRHLEGEREGGAEERERKKEI